MDHSHTGALNVATNQPASAAALNVAFERHSSRHSRQHFERHSSRHSPRSSHTHSRYVRSSSPSIKCLEVSGGGELHVTGEELPSAFTIQFLRANAWQDGPSPSSRRLRQPLQEAQTPHAQSNDPCREIAATIPRHLKSCKAGRESHLGHAVLDLHKTETHTALQYRANRQLTSVTSYPESHNQPPPISNSIASSVHVRAPGKLAPPQPCKMMTHFERPMMPARVYAGPAVTEPTPLAAQGSRAAPLRAHHTARRCGQLRVHRAATPPATDGVYWCERGGSAPRPQSRTGPRRSLPHEVRLISVLSSRAPRLTHCRPAPADANAECCLDKRFVWQSRFWACRAGRSQGRETHSGT